MSIRALVYIMDFMDRRNAGEHRENSHNTKMICYQQSR